MAPATLDLVARPATDPTPIFDLFRGHAATELLTVAVAHFRLFDLLASGPLHPDILQRQLNLADRPWSVLTTALRAFGLVTLDGCGHLQATPLATTHLSSDAPFSISGYLGLAAESSGVLAMRDAMLSNRPANAGAGQEGVSFIYRDDLPSAMEQQASARRLTLALAGRARNVAPVLADVVPLPGADVLLDVGGGTGLYAIAYLQRHPKLRAVVWDRPEVLKVAHEFAAAAGVTDRMQLQAGDMFRDEVPQADVALLSNVLHDWDVPQCRALVKRLAHALPKQGRLVIHDVFLNDALDGPLPVALYSADLFLLTEGRAYSKSQHTAWLAEAGLTPTPAVSTLVHASSIVATKR